MARKSPKLQKLHSYRAKRDFTKTAEPSGAAKVAPSQHLRFVIQKHAASHLHYDLRLELDGVFKSWAVTKGPSIDPADKRLAVEVEDHPLEYGDFEGTIPSGEYGGGTVQLWDRGFWAPEGTKAPQNALSDGDFKFILAGERLQGSWVLVRIKHNRGRDTRTNWLLIKHRDKYAKAGGTAALIAEDRSVASDRTMDQIARGVGEPPSPFMLAINMRQGANAVWHSNRASSRDPVAGVTLAKAVMPQTRTKALKVAPDFIEPQLCKLVDRPPGHGWAHEVKFDGYRVQIRVANHKATIRTRSGLDWTDKFSEIEQDIRRLSDCIIDGEVVALNAKDVPSFSALQASLSDQKTQGIIFFAFDLLVDAMKDIRSLSLAGRKSRLQQMLTKADLGTRVRFVEHFESDGAAMLESACKMELEGIVSKKLDAPYVSGRSGNWIKTKCRAGHEVVVGGWTTEEGTVRSLLAGVNRDGHLVYVGRIGTGYSVGVARKLLPKLQKLTAKDSPFEGTNAPRKESNIRWLAPELVAEIEFAGWTATGMIRQAAFKGLREDKRAADVVAELPASLTTETPDPVVAPGGTRGARHRTSSSPPAPAPAAKSKPFHGSETVMGVRLSKPDKVFWPDVHGETPVSKMDLALYYEAIGEWLMPHIVGRPCSLLRAPDGIKGQQFFQRHATAGISNLFSQVKIRGDREAYVQIDRIEALAAVAQIGALEIHPWNCGIDAPEVAGRLVFDLDPAPDVSFDAVIAAAFEVRERLKAVGLDAFCKTTGGKGLHVVTPLRGGSRAVKWPDAKNFAHIICAQMAGDAPAKYLDTMSKAQRKGRIFLDYLRNDRTATAVAVLSPRARDGAPISMPIDWKQLRKNFDPARFTTRTAPETLRKSNPWLGYDDAARSLSDAIARVVSARPKQQSKRPP